MLLWLVVPYTHTFLKHLDVVLLCECPWSLYLDQFAGFWVELTKWCFIFVYGRGNVSLRWLILDNTLSLVQLSLTAGCLNVGIRSENGCNYAETWLEFGRIVSVFMMQLRWKMVRYLTSTQRRKLTSKTLSNQPKANVDPTSGSVCNVVTTSNVCWDHVGRRSIINVTFFLSLHINITFRDAT